MNVFLTLHRFKSETNFSFTEYNGKNELCKTTSTAPGRARHKGCE